MKSVTPVLIFVLSLMLNERIVFYAMSGALNLQKNPRSEAWSEKIEDESAKSLACHTGRWDSVLFWTALIGIVYNIFSPKMSDLVKYLPLDIGISY